MQKINTETVTLVFSWLHSPFALKTRDQRLMLCINVAGEKDW